MAARNRENWGAFSRAGGGASKTPRAVLARVADADKSDARRERRQERPPNPGGYDGQGARGWTHTNPSHTQRDKRGVRRPPRMGAAAV